VLAASAFTSPVRADLDRRCPSDAAGTAQITLAGLLGEMVDLTHLARVPVVPYTTALASSHNRASDAAAPGSKDWFANRDVIALSEAEPSILLDVEGPGAITRIWSANPAGVLRVYVDGAAAPAVEADFAQVLRGEVAPFTSPYAFVAAGGHNLYFPIAFAQRVRVTVTGQARALFYHVAYRRYPSGTAVQSYGAPGAGEHVLHAHRGRAPAVDRATASCEARGHGRACERSAQPRRTRALARAARKHRGREAARERRRRSGRGRSGGEPCVHAEHVRGQCALSHGRGSRRQHAALAARPPRAQRRRCVARHRAADRVRRGRDRPRAAR
jgi:hypothetical protein